MTFDKQYVRHLVLTAVVVILASIPLASHLTVSAQTTQPQTTGQSLPPTRNPQSSSTSLLPEQTNIQPTTGQQLLDTSNVQIDVPRSSGTPKVLSATKTKQKGINWPLFIVSMILVSLAVVIFYATRTQPIVSKPPVVEFIEPQAVLAEPKTVIQKSKKSKKKKSKHRY